MIIHVRIADDAGNEIARVAAECELPKGYVETPKDAQKIGKAVEWTVANWMMKRA